VNPFALFALVLGLLDAVTRVLLWAVGLL